jgi:hypothetical protein
MVIRTKMRAPKKCASTQIDEKHESEKCFQCIFSAKVFDNQSFQEFGKRLLLHFSNLNLGKTWVLGLLALLKKRKN